MVSALCGMLADSDAAERGSTEPAQAVPAGARLLGAGGAAIGAISGRTTGFDGDANMVGAYGVLSARGYFADVLPSGALGQVLSLVYASADCSGLPAIEQSSVVGGPLPVPGYVFAFGAPARAFNVPADATLREIAVASVRQRTRTGFACVAGGKRAMVYPLQINRVAVSGFADHYAAPLRVQTVAASAAHGDGGDVAMTRATVAAAAETGAGADVAPDTPECAPGCYTPYLGDHICEAECATSLCGFDAGDCSAAYIARARKHEAGMCAPTCEASSLGDGFCDAACNVSGCDFDQGDCSK